jgi:hypothetical protein
LRPFRRFYGLENHIIEIGDQPRFMKSNARGLAQSNSKKTAVLGVQDLAVVVAVDPIDLPKIE